MKVKMTNKRMIKKNINYIKKLFFYLYFKNILLTQTKQFISDFYFFLRIGILLFIDLIFNIK